MVSTDINGVKVGVSCRWGCCSWLAALESARSGRDPARTGLEWSDLLAERIAGRRRGGIGRGGGNRRRWYKDTTEAVVDATRTILQQCERSKTVRRVIHTGSVFTASPLRENGDGYKESVNESCWTPLGLSYSHSNDGFLDVHSASRDQRTASLVEDGLAQEDGAIWRRGGVDGRETCHDRCNNTTLKMDSWQVAATASYPAGVLAYVSSKTVSEEELLKYNDDFSKARAFDVVVLLCGLVGGDILLPHISGSIHVMLSPLTGVKLHHKSLKSLQTLLGSIPLVHIDDICEAHIFCMERSLDVAGGRYLCTTAHTNMQDVLEHYAGKHPELEIVDKEVVGEGVRVHVNTNKLVELGFKYKYGAKEVLDGSVDCGNEIELCMKIPTIESQESNILTDKGNYVCCHKGSTNKDLRRICRNQYGHLGPAIGY
ncbi:Dihydroflavonol-4-reductase [Triticum urartu]|uniref:Dihydroflavonol-4-reductase n=1 Tax=Triticum urartu TaxID=4572 RepID=M8AA48_TRIUA|nr:Dihydroflavonol-4-reductase [Triticum urartu]